MPSPPGEAAGAWGLREAREGRLGAGPAARLGAEAERGAAGPSACKGGVLLLLRARLREDGGLSAPQPFSSRFLVALASSRSWKSLGYLKEAVFAFVLMFWSNYGYNEFVKGSLP